MVNPNLSRISEKKLTPTINAKRLFQIIYREQSKAEAKEDEVPKINVSELISKMSFYYEKIRNTVDYKEEHLLRKNAIERIIKRKVVIEGTISVKGVNSVEIARHLLTELIRAAYLPNNSIPETKIGEVAKTIKKYLDLKRAIAKVKGWGLSEKNDLNNWIIALAASDIEERLGLSKINRTVVDYINKILLKNIELPGDSEYETDKEIQIFLGIHRCYLKFDRDMMSFILFKYYVADWKNPNAEKIEEVAAKIVFLRKAINKQLEHPMVKQLNRIISRYTVFFAILTDVIKENPVAVYESIKKDPKVFPREIKKACGKKYKESSKKLWRAAVRSIIYIFITKSVFAVLLELPATKWFGEELNVISLIINISFPAVLLFFIVLFTKMPSEDNSNKIKEGIEEVVFEEHERKEPFRLRKPARRSKSMGLIFGILYFITFFFSFGAVIWALNKINFTWVSIVIFLFFLTFVSFFSIRIRKNARDMIIIPPRENILSFISDFFYIPIVAVGKWMSEKFSQVNVFVFILDFIIEAPFKIFVEIAEEWTRYVRERKEDIV
ncbi:MAG: hypothetical protein U9M94_03815 [Patescibacteria group bacterium]|nr:hypothetical protein [Patescibacteria group bacterium]